MRTLIELYFIPGAAGNFFSRCLNLLDNAYHWVPPTATKFSFTLEEKRKMLSYDIVKNRVYNIDNFNSASPQKDWIEFENQLRPFENPRKGTDYSMLPNDAIAIWTGHPHPNYMRLDHLNRIFFYIDPTDAFEWAILNCLYKDSFFNMAYLLNANELKNNPVVNKISLAKIIQNRDSFIKEFCRVCAIFNRQVSELETKYILELYDDWITTTLPREKFQEFKDQIGWYL